MYIAFFKTNYYLDNDNHEVMFFTPFVIHFIVTLISLKSEVLSLVH